jgi:hypothetical protein
MQDCGGTAGVAGCRYCDRRCRVRRPDGGRKPNAHCGRMPRKRRDWGVILSLSSVKRRRGVNRRSDSETVGGTVRAAASWRMTQLCRIHCRQPQSAPLDLEHLHQPSCIGRGGALLVIVEIDEDGPPLPAPSSNVARPGAQRPIRIMTFVASAGPVPAYVDVARSYLPR